MYDEKDLIRRMREHDDKAFEEIYHHYNKLIHYVVYQILNDEEDTKEIVDDTFVQVYKSIASHNDEASFKYWIITIAKNFAYKKVTEYQKARSGINNLRNDMEDTKDEDAVTELSEALKKLTKEERDIFVYHAIHNLTYQEIADIIGSSKSSVNSMYEAIIKKIR